MADASGSRGSSFHMSDGEIESYNNDIAKNEALAAAREENDATAPLRSLKMPEDERIKAKRLTGMRLTDECLLKRARSNHESFEYDPETRNLMIQDQVHHQAKG